MAGKKKSGGKPPWLQDKNDNGVKDSKDKKNMASGKKKAAKKK